MKRGKSSKETSAKLVVDLTKIRLQGPSGVRCSYKHHPENRGFDAVLERIRFALICRQCEAAPCVAACPRQALEKLPQGAGVPARLESSSENLQGADSNSRWQDAGVLRRANMLCTGCGTCALACPFGTISGDLMAFASSVCDLCQDRLAPGEKPLCVRTCGDGSIDYQEIQPSADLVEVVENIVVKGADGRVWKPFLKSKQEAGK